MRPEYVLGLDVNIISDCSQWEQQQSGKCPGLRLCFCVVNTIMSVCCQCEQRKTGKCPESGLGLNVFNNIITSSWRCVLRVLPVRELDVQRISDVVFLQSMGGSVDFTSEPGETVFCLSVNLGIPTAHEIAAFLHESKSKRTFSYTLKNESSDAGACRLRGPSLFPPIPQSCFLSLLMSLDFATVSTLKDRSSFSVALLHLNLLEFSLSLSLLTCASSDPRIYCLTVFSRGTCVRASCTSPSPLVSLCWLTTCISLSFSPNKCVGAFDFAFSTALSSQGVRDLMSPPRMSSQSSSSSSGSKHPTFPLTGSLEGKAPGVYTHAQTAHVRAHVRTRHSHALARA